MPTKFKVTEVKDVNDFESSHGTMFGFRLACIRDDGTPETIEINAKSSDRYKAGSEFWAEPTGKEFKGIKKYKSVKPPDGTTDSPTSSGNAPSSRSEPKRAPMPYATAALLLRRLLDDFGVEPSKYIFEAILDGQVENPVKPKTTVRFMGNEIETAGIGQETWDSMMALCERYGKLTDNKAVRALLIATCGVQTRNDLTEANGQLFVEALRLSIATEEAKQAPEPDEEPSW